jgi:hypothetical protein
VEAARKACDMGTPDDKKAAAAAAGCAAPAETPAATQ